MAHLFVQDSEGTWARALLDGDRFSLHPASKQLLKRLKRNARPTEGFLLQRADTAFNRVWMLFASPDRRVFVNGNRMSLGVRQLRDLDEILVYPTQCQRKRSKNSSGEVGARLFFSTEQLAQVVPFVAMEHDVFCVRCQQRIEPGHPAVQCPCPECGHWHHEGGELKCWTYGETCAMCNQSTSHDADYRWTPEDL